MIQQNRINVALNKSLVELQTLYDECINDLQDKRSGAHVLCTKLNLTGKSIAARVRRELADRGVQLHLRDECQLRKANTVKQNWESMSEERYEAVVANISAQMQNFHAGLTPEEKEQRYELWLGQIHNFYKALTDEEREDIRSRKQASWNAWSVADKLAYVELCRTYGKAWWNNLTKEERKQFAVNVLNGQIAKGFSYGVKPIVKSINGEDVRFSSSWEVPVYELLQKLGVKFTFANKQGNILMLATRPWNPDFIVEGVGIVEVKGHYLAYEHFFDEILPDYKASEHAASTDLWLCDYDLTKANIHSLTELLAWCTLVHKAESK